MGCPRWLERPPCQCDSSDKDRYLTASILAALLAGALSFLSPCVLPLVPPYLCYMAGISVEQFRDERYEAKPQVRKAVLLAALFFTLGFATVFVALGAGA